MIEKPHHDLLTLYISQSRANSPQRRNAPIRRNENREVKLTPINRGGKPNWPFFKKNGPGFETEDCIESFEICMVGFSRSELVLLVLKKPIKL